MRVGAFGKGQLFSVILHPSPNSFSYQKENIFYVKQLLACQNKLQHLGSWVFLLHHSTRASLAPFCTKSTAWDVLTHVHKNRQGVTTKILRTAGIPVCGEQCPKRGPSLGCTELVRFLGKESWELALLGGTLGQTQGDNFVILNSGKQHSNWHRMFSSKMCNSTVIRHQT